MSSEPRLSPEDRRIWGQLERASLAWAKTLEHNRRVDTARRRTEEMVARRPDAYVAWSGGKDSTALTHMVCVDRGIAAQVMSVKDDLDFPGEEAYVQRWATTWGIRLDIVRPEFSLQGWLAEHASDTSADDDFHGRSSAFSDAAFYSLIEEYRQAAGLPGVYLGLRAEESVHRLRNRRFNGHTYTKLDGETVCQPLCDWHGLDVYAYLLSHGIDLLSVYRCVRLHREPWLVRKSWWLPGAHSRHGGMAWLRTYYPSLFYRLCELLPDARVHA